MFISANKYIPNDEEIPYEYSVWRIKILTGEDKDWNTASYLALFNVDGEEWWPLEDFEADLYKIISEPSYKKKV